jgi:hypothetical protein
MMSGLSLFDCSLLLIEYVADTAIGHAAENALVRKDKTSLPFPVYHPASHIPHKLMSSWVSSFAFGAIALQR